MTKYRLAVVGGGNMGTALVGGLLAGGWPATDLAVVEVVAGQREALSAMFPGIAVTATVPPCDAAVIAVKPYDAAAAATTAVGAGARRVLSIAAGVSVDTLQQACGDGVAVVRSIPNTPALLGKGAAAMCGGPFATDDDLDWAEGILGVVGTVERVTESLLDAVTGLAASGPAYLFLVAEALTDAGVLAGLTRPVADALVRQLFVGSAAMLAERGDPVALRAMVTSPGGTTAAGVRVLEEHGTRSAFLEAVMAATTRSQQLGQQH
ncbi:MAG: pyrroline-5-carboxylate reductase [Actinomycetota bacterium]|nr:pyrroline-5-carboxylate reductase [Actinomycetota bacterium]